MNQLASLLFLGRDKFIIIHVRGKIEALSWVTLGKNISRDRNVYSLWPFCNSLQAFILVWNWCEDLFRCIECISTQLEVGRHVVLITLLSDCLEINLFIFISRHCTQTLTSNDVIPALWKGCELFVKVVWVVALHFHSGVRTSLCCIAFIANWQENLRFRWVSTVSYWLLVGRRSALHVTFCKHFI